MNVKRFLTQKSKDAIKYFVFLCFCCVLFSCSKKEEKIPAGIISEDLMVQVMVDVHLAESRSQYNSSFDDAKKIKQGYYKFIFNKYKITSEQLFKSWTFYAAHPEIFSAVYDEVITELSKKQAETSKIIKPLPGNRSN